MARNSVVRLASGACLASLVTVYGAAAALPVGAQTEQQVTICQATGSVGRPYVFTTIDASDLPEHLARGDYRAGSIAECSAAPSNPTPQTAAAPSPTALATPTAAPTAAAAGAQTSPRVQQQGLGIVPVPDLPVSRVLAQATPSPTVAPVSAATPQAAEAADEPPVSVLPKSGGEPDRPMLVLVLLALLGVGLGLRRLAPERR